MLEEIDKQLLSQQEIKKAKTKDIIEFISKKKQVPKTKINVTFFLNNSNKASINFKYCNILAITFMF